MEQTLVARIGTDPAALTRLVSLLRRRGFEIQSMNVERPGTDRARRATLVVLASDPRRLATQLMRLIDVIDVSIAPAMRSEGSATHARAEHG